MKIYYSKKKKKYYIITDPLMIKILDEIKKESKTLSVTTVTHIAAKVMPDSQKRTMVYRRLKKLNDMGLIEIIRKLRVKYIKPMFEEIKLFKYTTIATVPLVAIILSLVLYSIVNNIYSREILVTIFVILLIYIGIFLKEREVLINIENL